MGINESDCLKLRSEILETINENTKLIKMNVDLAVIPTVQSEFQYKAYARLKLSQERTKTLSVILKISSELSALFGAVAVLVQIFV